MGKRSPDKYAIPLCYNHHNALHMDGNEDKYLAENGIDGLSVAAALWSFTGDLERGEEYMRELLK